LPFHLARPAAALHSTDANFNGNYPYGSASKGPYLERPSKVGSYPANVLGIFDMHGNVWEWCADWYATYPTGPVVDPSGPTEGSVRVVRGGGWRNRGRFCRAAYRDKYLPEYRDNYYGFRVAFAASEQRQEKG
jgi:formylglycine-generating enzyme required for sulfatase activity